LLLFIARSKLVPDFALTVHLIHLIVTTLYTKEIPTQLFWWGLQICSAGLMICLGIWACQWRELKPMAFGGKGKQSTPAQDPAAVEEGSSLATDRGPGSDGAGVYEMVGMSSR
jgi:ABC-type nickel/cobalt efflux system permease component RcnA